MTIACLGWGSLIWDPRDLLLGSAWREDGPQLLLQVVEELRDVRKGREMLSFGGCRHLWPPFGTVAAGFKIAGQEIRTVGGASVSPRLFRRVDAAHPVVPQADGDDLITLVKLVLSRMDDDEAASFAAPLATLLDDLRCTVQPPPTTEAQNDHHHRQNAPHGARGNHPSRGRLKSLTPKPTLACIGGRRPLSKQTPAVQPWPREPPFLPS